MPTETQQWMKDAAKKIAHMAWDNEENAAKEIYAILAAHAPQQQECGTCKLCAKEQAVPYGHGLGATCLKNAVGAYLYAPLAAPPVPDTPGQQPEKAVEWIPPAAAPLGEQCVSDCHRDSHHAYGCPHDGRPIPAAPSVPQEEEKK